MVANDTRNHAFQIHGHTTYAYGSSKLRESRVQHMYMMNHRTTKMPALHNNSGLQALHDSTVRCLWSGAMPEPFTAESTTAVAFIKAN